MRQTASPATLSEPAEIPKEHVRIRTVRRLLHQRAQLNQAPLVDGVYRVGLACTRATPAQRDAALQELDDKLAELGVEAGVA